MKPFLQGKKNHTAEPLRLPPGMTPHASNCAPRDAANAGGKLSGPTVELVKEGDKIVRILVTCVCGERVEVECLYPPGH